MKAFHSVHFPTCQWAKRTSGPFPLNNYPEIDTTLELKADQALFYQTQIGVLRWCVELGRIDIITEVSELASYLALPREGHLEAVFHLFNFLEKRLEARIAFDPTFPEIDMRAFKECDWRAFYGNVKEALPPNAPTPRGKEVDLRLFVDSYHAGDDESFANRIPYLSELGSDYLVFQERINHQDERFWRGVCCNDARNGDTPRDLLQVTYDGCFAVRAILHLW